MSQSGNADTSSSKEKRLYRKGHPMSTSERQQSFLERKKATHKEIKVLVANEVKNKLQTLCSKNGLSQAEMISLLIQKAD